MAFVTAAMSTETSADNAFSLLKFEVCRAPGAMANLIAAELSMRAASAVDPTYANGATVTLLQSRKAPQMP